MPEETHRRASAGCGGLELLLEFLRWLVAKRRMQTAAIASYLDIERARFEERLRVSIDVPKELLSVRIPSLLVQPLVENAIKHGITPSRFGGEVRIRARLERALEDVTRNSDVLEITVSDSGIGASEIELARGRRRGVGLSNLEERLRCYGGASASLQDR